FVAVQPEEPLFQNRVAPVPHRQRKADALMAIAYPGDPVLVPAIGARARVVVRQVLPRGAVRAVVFAHRAPGAVADVWAPPAPVLRAHAVLFDADRFGGRLHVL